VQRREVTLPGAASSVPTARRFVEDALAVWGLRDLSWTAALVVTELAANAALHAGTDFTVEVSADDSRVRVVVRDLSGRAPRQRAHSREATTGRGLHLVETLSSSWGVARGEPGKAVWAELDAAVPDLDDADDDEREDGAPVDVEAVLDAFGGDDDDNDDDGEREDGGGQRGTGRQADGAAAPRPGGRVRLLRIA
jgi:anti-sigma regulatory factor (Ser/Thr protein kinase)